jgi:hypothetical protein
MQRWISVGISGRSKAGVVETVVVLVNKTCVLGVGSSGILDTNSIADIKVQKVVWILPILDYLLQRDFVATACRPKAGVDDSAP